MKGERIGWIRRPTRRCAASCGGTRARVTGGCWSAWPESGIDAAEDLAASGPQAQGQEALEPGLGFQERPRGQDANRTTTHLGLQARARRDTGAVVAAELPADDDTTTLPKTLQTSRRWMWRRRPKIRECVTELPRSEPKQKGFARWHGMMRLAGRSSLSWGAGQQAAAEIVEAPVPTTSIAAVCAGPGFGPAAQAMPAITSPATTRC